MPAERFLNERIDVGHGTEVVECREAMCPNHSLEFATGALLDLRIEHHGKGERVQRCRSLWAECQRPCWDWALSDTNCFCTG